jgi:hypothetical protein
MNGMQLLMTGLLGIIIMVIYVSSIIWLLVFKKIVFSKGVFGYYSQTLANTMIYSGSPSIDICTNTFNCFMFAAGSGFRAGGGVGDGKLLFNNFTIIINYL